ncbi:riboflavin biosynthesis pyrimidine reductase [Streptomyces griseochromogenes]|uniref:Riboflavin biosynthesis pyrimidine reductase n=1 Tax=Streptomyces griseochromogenes TaxID=68214 RepID=A0ABS4MA43_9ACTN|nr:hypothetical protein [Streptomyces griseochromogenes]MBP2056547.1 riboflavin biosynthesis pyrimidine reductase [Streptomyces griseochromogenes]
MRRFTCKNVLCGRRTFVKQTPGLTRRHGQRTERLRSPLAAVVLERQEVVPMPSPASAPPAPSSLPRIVAASLIGTTIEWYDNSFDQSDNLQFFHH